MMLDADVDIAGGQPNNTDRSSGSECESAVSSWAGKSVRLGVGQNDVVKKIGSMDPDGKFGSASDCLAALW